MGIAFVFLLYIVFLIAACVPLVLTGLGVAAALSRGQYSGLRRRLLLGGALLPVLGCGYIAFCILAMAGFGLLTNRDVGFGDGYELPLHNGYRIVAIDTLDSAYVGPASMFASGVFGLREGQRDAFGEVVALQEEGDWIALGWDGRPFDAADAFRKPIADRWALFNTRTKARVDVTSEIQLQSQLARRGMHPQLQTTEQFYNHRRYRWYDALALVALAVPPLVVLVLTLKTVKRMRHQVASALTGSTE